MSSPIFKILSTPEWDRFERDGHFDGTPFDKADGYVHLSAADQLAGTCSRHFSAKTGLVAIAIDPDKLGRGLRWEKVREDTFFPHFYGSLPHAAVISADPIPDDPDARTLALAMLGV